MKYSFYYHPKAIVVAGIAAAAISVLNAGVTRAQIKPIQATDRIQSTIRVIPLSLTASLAAYEETVRGKKEKALSRLTEALEQTGVDDAVNNGAVTIFAPSNAAFLQAPKKWFLPEQKETLKSLLRDHTVTGRYTYAELLNRTKASGGDLALKTLSGGTLHVRTAGGGNSLFLEGGRDPASNGIRRSRVALSQKRVIEGKKGTAFVMDYFVTPVFPQRID